MATLRLVRAAERSGAKRFVFMSAIGASLQSPTRFFRSKALARRAVESADLATTVFAPSIVYSPGDPWLTLLERLAWLFPVVPIAGAGKARFQPIWAEDVADCIVAALERAGVRSAGRVRPGRPRVAVLRRPGAGRAAPRSGASGRWCTCRCRSSGGSLRALERVAGPAAFATPDEAELMEEPMITLAGNGGRRGAGRHAAADECGPGSGIALARPRRRRPPSGWSGFRAAPIAASCAALAPRAARRARPSRAGARPLGDRAGHQRGVAHQLGLHAPDRLEVRARCPARRPARAAPRPTAGPRSAGASQTSTTRARSGRRGRSAPRRARPSGCAARRSRPARRRARAGPARSRQRASALR